MTLVERGKKESESVAGFGVFTRLQPVTPTARAGLVGWWPHCRTGGGQKLVGW